MYANVADFYNNYLKKYICDNFILFDGVKKILS